MDIVNIICVLFMSCAIKGLTGFEEEQFWNNDGNAYYGEGNQVRYRATPRRFAPRYGHHGYRRMSTFAKQQKSPHGRFQTRTTMPNRNNAYKYRSRNPNKNSVSYLGLPHSPKLQRPYLPLATRAYRDHLFNPKRGLSSINTHASQLHPIPQKLTLAQISHLPSQRHLATQINNKYDLNYDTLDIKRAYDDFITGRYDNEQTAYAKHSDEVKSSENKHSGLSINWNDMLKVIDQIFQDELEESLNSQHSLETESAEIERHRNGGSYAKTRNGFITSWLPHQVQPTYNPFSPRLTTQQLQNTMRISAKTLAKDSNSGNVKKPEELTPDKMAASGKKPDVLITVTHPEHGTHQWWYRQTTPVQNKTQGQLRSRSEVNHGDPYSINENRQNSVEHPNGQGAGDNGKGTGFYNENVDESKKSMIKWEEFVWRLWKPLFFQRLLDLARSTVHIYFFPTDVNKNGEIDVIEDIDETGPMYYERPRADVFQPLNRKLYGAIDKYELIKRQNKQKQGPNPNPNKPVRLDDYTHHRVRRDTGSSAPHHSIEEEIVSSPEFKSALDNLINAFQFNTHDYTDTQHNHPQPDAPHNSIHQSPFNNKRHSVSIKEPTPLDSDEAGVPLSPHDRHNMIQNLWPDVSDNSEKLGVSAKEGRPQIGGQDPYGQQQQRLPMNQYSDVLNNAYGFNQMTSDASSYPLLATLLAGNYNDKNDAASYDPQPQNRHKPQGSASVNQLWPGATYTDNDATHASSYPYEPAKPSYPNPAPQQRSYSSDPHGIVDTAQPHNPAPTHNRKAAYGGDSQVAKEGYGGHSSSKGYGSSSSHGASSGYGSHGSSSGYGGHSSGGSGYGHSSGGGYGGSHMMSGYGGPSSGGIGYGGGGHSSGGYGHSSGGYGGGGGGYGKIKRWEGGEKSYGSGKKGTKGTDGRESHIYTQGKWHEKNKDSRKSKGNKVKTYSYGGHGWYKEETHGEESGFGDKNAYHNHEDWKTEKGKHEAQEYPHHEYNTKTHGYHKDLKGYHK